mmetsp:Transcript_16074/g.19574  ORF Transcript_16074/g.19574 Transcript_16074/m.19574 type:complete len:95 (-) Transcript_16074:545-829(-)
MIYLWASLLNQKLMKISNQRLCESQKSKDFNMMRRTFVNKTSNFQGLLDIRHSVMLLGSSGSAKTTIWKTLQGARNLNKPSLRLQDCQSESSNW